MKMQYKKLAILLLLSSLSLHVCAMDSDDDGSGIGDGYCGDSKQSDSQLEQGSNFNPTTKATKQQNISNGNRRVNWAALPGDFIKELQESCKKRKEAEEAAWLVDRELPLVKKKPVSCHNTVPVQKNILQDLHKRVFPQTTLYQALCKLSWYPSDRLDEEVKVDLLNDLLVAKTGDSLIEMHEALRAQEIVAAGSDKGKVKVRSDFWAMLQRAPVLTDPSCDEPVKSKSSTPPSSPYAPCGNPKDLLIYNQAKALQRQFDREDESVWQHLGRAEVKVALVAAFGAPVFELLVKNYGPSVLGFIEQKLGFGPSQEEQQAMMQQSMMKQMIKYRLAQAELNEKDLKVSILRAVHSKHLIEAEKEELALDAVKTSQELWRDIVDLTRQKIKQGPNFPASKLKELNELKALYKEGQMIAKELQDLKPPAGFAMPVPGVA